MRSVVQRLAVFLLGCVGLCAWLLAAVAVAASGSLEGSFVQEEAPLSLTEPILGVPTITPEQVVVDAASRTKYQGLGEAAAVALARQAFHVERAAWTPPGEGGGQITKYLGENGAVEKLPDGAHAVVSSTIPLRINDGSGLAPTSLALSHDGEAFVPANPVIPVAISDHAEGGVAFPAGLNVAPVSMASESPVLVGNSVMFANAAQDTDLLAEPRPGGAEVSWQLRSQEAPADEALAFNLPAGAVLQWSTKTPGGVEVLVEGAPILLVPPASAVGADGASVPVSYAISGNVLTTHVDLSGNVDFPVLVDPTLFFGFYGASNGANVWSGWTHSSSWASPVYEEYFNLIKIGTNPGASIGSTGGLLIKAPGLSGKSGSAGITRADLVGVTNGVSGQSRLIATINESNGPIPDYSYNGTVGATGPLPLYEPGELSNRPIAFCASGAGGHDGGNPGLCNEQQYQGSSFLIEDEITSAPQNHFNWIQLEGAQMTYRDVTEPNKVVLNTAGYTGAWSKTGPTNWKIEAEDEGLGIVHFELQIPRGASPTFTENVNCNVANGFTGCPTSYASEPINLSGVNKTGALQVSPIAVDLVENFAAPVASYAKLYLDQVAPVIGTLKGSLAAAAGNVIGDGNYTLEFAPEDGSTASPQSGVESVEVKVDGSNVYTAKSACSAPVGVPASGCFALSGSWVMNGQTYGVGPHTVSVTAKDWVGNESTQSFGVTVNEAAFEPVGPGAVNLETGDFKVSTTDVSVSGGAATLGVGRTYDSRLPSQGAEGPLGPQWILTPSGPWHSLTVKQGPVSLYNAVGKPILFATKEGGGYVSPPGYQLYTLTKLSSSEFQLTDTEENYTRFTQVTGTNTYYPSSTVQAAAAGGLNKVSYSFAKTAEGIVEPTKILGPEPSGGTCTASLVKGCRALTFNYATSTTATGEAPGEWGDFKGRLTRVFSTAWDPAKSEMTTTTVAQYAYDKQGRLRAEWNPLISPALKESYGYDAETPSHITAVNSPAQQPWLLNYGTIPGDLSHGRLLSVTRPNAATALGSGIAPGITTIPTLSNTKPVLGSAVSVTNGTWSNSPLAYSYQWESCNQWGEQCQPIAGATNQAYTPIVSDGNHTLAAQVVALNAGGATQATTVVSALVPTGSEPTQEPVPTPPNPGTNSLATIEYHVPISGTGAPYPMDKTTIQNWSQVQLPAVATAIFPGDEPEGWPAQDYKRASIFYMDSANRTVNTAAPGGGISTTEYDLANNNVTRTLSPNNRVAALAKGSESATFAKKYSTESSYTTDGTELTSSLGPLHAIKLASGTEVAARNLKQYYYDEGSPEGKTFHLVTKTTEAAESEGSIFDTRTVTTAYSGQGNLGWNLHAPTSSTTSTGGETLVATTKYDPATGNVTEAQAPTGSGAESKPAVYASAFGTVGSEPGQLKEPRSATIGSTGNVTVLDSGNARVEEYSPAGTYLAKFGSLGTGNGQLKTPYALTVDATGNTLVTDYGNSRVEEFTATGEYKLQFGSAGTAGGQFKEPRGIAVGKTGNIFVADSGNNRIEKFNSSGTFLEMFGFGVRTGANTFEVCTTACKVGLAGSGNGQFKTPRNIAITAGGDVWVVDAGNNRIEEITEFGDFDRVVGSTGTGNGQFTSPIGIAVDTAGNVTVTDSGNNRIEKFTSTGGFLWATGAKGTGGGQFEEPAGLTITSSGSTFVTDLKNNRVQRWLPEMSGNPGAHKTQTIFYTAAANEAYPSCGNHPEWASLPCQAQPATQPENGLSNLPVTTYPSYNIWNEPLSVVDTVGSTKRTTTITYDEAGRTLTTAISSTVGTPLPTVTSEYNTETGALKKQSTPTQSVSGIENSLGQLTSYTDADGNASTYEYEPEKDFRLIKTNDGKGTQTDGYGTTTGRLVSVKDSAAGTFTATYDVEGNITNLGYPNGMSANYTYNNVGEPFNLEYIKTTHCTSNCTWFSDAIKPSIHGQWLSQASSLSKQAYRYDEIGRLTEAQDTPLGSGCTTRLYAFDEDGNRTSQTSREPGSEGKCATTGGSTHTYAYDTADRLNDTGVAYDTFGNTTSLPAADVGGAGLTSTYYVNNRTASLTQNGQSIGYNLDPAGRTREANYTGTINQTTINHYAGPEDSPAWSITGAVWTRNIPGITGLAAIQTNGGTPTLQLTNLHGDIIATAALSETETKLLSTSDTTEYGVPRTASPTKYSWLGSAQRPTELSSGAIDMGARTYIPQLGRFTQTDPQPGGSINSYAYTFDDPVNLADLSGEWTNTVTYDYEAAENGTGDPNLPEGGTGTGGIQPPPINPQLEAEFIAHPPWLAATVYSDEAQGGRGTPMAMAHIAAPCAGGDRPNSGYCGPRLPSGNLCGKAVAACQVVLGKVQAPSCTVTFAGHTSTCQQVLDRAKAEYAADNMEACTTSIDAVAGALGGRYGRKLGAIIGARIVGPAVGNVVCK